MANTTNYGWVKPTVGGSDNTWGTLLNTIFDEIDVDLKAVSDSVGAASVLTALLTVDGAGSGLDADTLDGIQGNKHLKHAGSYTSSSVTVSASAPSGGSDGDVWFKV